MSTHSTTCASDELSMVIDILEGQRTQLDQLDAKIEAAQLDQVICRLRAILEKVDAG